MGAPVALAALLLFVGVTVRAAGAQSGLPPIGSPLDPPPVYVPAERVTLRRGLWADRLATNARVTVWSDFARCEETGRIANFARAGGLEPGGFQGTPFDDSDVYKVVEGACRILAQHADPALEALVESVVTKIAAAQEPDGYLYTARTLGRNDDFTGPARWTNLGTSHELYDAGHLYEAAVAHHRATGRETLLDVARRNADLVCATFGTGEGALADVPGHEEIELALVALWRETGEARYLDQAEVFVDRRGRAAGRVPRGAYWQDHLPLVEQREPVGHAVRAGYFFAGATDVARARGRADWIAAVDTLWTDVVATRLHLSGSVGARRSGEAFGAAFELPNGSAYLETCAAIAFALWTERLWPLDGQGGRIDVLERTLLDGVLPGVSLAGDSFFYPNPLAFDGHSPFNQGQTGRCAWFGCSCCPVNVVRLLPQVPGWMYATRGDDRVCVNIHAASEARIDLGGSELRLAVETEAPWDGHVEVRVDPGAPRTFTLALRVPGWATGRPVPSGLYTEAAGPDPAARRSPSAPFRLALQAGTGERQALALAPRDGYVEVSRLWNPGDTLVLDLDQRPRRVVADARVTADAGRVALEYGPLLYCLEAVDHGGRVSDLVLPDEAEVRVESRPDLLGGIRVLRATGRRVRLDADGRAVAEPVELTAIPYALWAHRGTGEMAVWLPRTPEALERSRANPLTASATAGASHCFALDVVEALNDGVVPEGVDPDAIPRFTWWDHVGSDEWVQYDFARPATVSAATAWFYDDTGRGACRLPASWRLLARVGGRFTEVAHGGAEGLVPNGPARLAFQAVEADALRLEVRLRDGFSGGLLEWSVE